MMKIVTCYTPDYERYVAELAASCPTPLHAYAFGSRGSWMRNVMLKALAVHQALDELHDDVL